MVLYCRVNGCSNRADRDKDKQFYRLPAVISHQGEETRKLSLQRRRLWLAKLNQNLTDKNLDNIRVCSDHFISKTKAGLYPPDHPDWVPHVNIGCSNESPEVISKRYERKRERKRRSDAANAQTSLNSLRKCVDVVDSASGGVLSSPCLTVETGVESQTELNLEHVSSLQTEVENLRKENKKLKLNLESCTVKYSEKYFEGDDDKVRYFTGLPNFCVLVCLFSLIEHFLSSKSLTKFQTLILTLMKLRLNLSNYFLSYEFGVSRSTVSRIFSSVISVMFVRLKPLVMWPDREALRKTMPMQFRKHFGTKCAVIIDCFEVFIERPSNLKARAETWSSYKHHNTVKFLVGITPQGVVSFISRAWGGRVSDRHITENCGFLNNILPGDLVLADRGFDIQSSVGSMCAEVKIPAFTKGRNQLSPLDVESTRKLAHVRIHVERVIGLVRQKYTILSSVLPIDFLMSRNGETLIDKVTYVCCCLINMCESVVNFN